jgi:hypothetical protein
MLKESELQSGVGLSINNVTSARWHHLPPFLLPVRFATFNSANISETARAGRGVSKEHEYKTEVWLAISQIVSARWRHLPSISINDLFSQLLKALTIRKRSELLAIFPQKQQESL